MADRLRLSVRTLRDAHVALVAVRPVVSDPPLDWRSYYYRSATVYREVAATDPDHANEALYWAEREHEKAQRPLDKIPTDVVDSGPVGRVRLHSLDALCQDLDGTLPPRGGRSAAYHLACAELFAVVSEIDRFNHHQARYYADKSRRDAREAKA
ncbi:AMED_5909 family protein [Actinokineospora auranticolor]|uniref:Uncharacterized protein n=1 Tax=Actinokineospora auranticolor TaxID=155976 RepID=A0A2S6GBY6_9PSEU|nr:AMED_5909 family protein [Actinokineospora auranticolor]PPK61878.1 hypothetical protein CLV40_13827 [Actinokineospora auranticolor]